jgi:hypothetical protein
MGSCDTAEATVDATTDEQIRHAEKDVENSIPLLRRAYGEDWKQEIEKEKIDMSSPSNCVLGQLFGEHREGLVAISNKSGAPVEEVAEMTAFSMDWEKYSPATLTAVWRGVLRE